MKYLIANFKQNKNSSEIELYESGLRRKGIRDIKVIICPTHPFLHKFGGNNYFLGAQDVSIYTGGAYTGEVSASQLASIGVKYVLVGHSERRAYFNEQEGMLITKIHNALANGLTPVFCVGESAVQKEQGITFNVLEQQLATVMNDFTREELKNFIIAYEPLWAIGTGLVPTKNDIEEINSFIEKIIMDYYELDVPVLYGGSVNSKTILEFTSINNLDGFLVGGASLDIDEFGALIDILS